MLVNLLLTPQMNQTITYQSRYTHISTIPDLLYCKPITFLKFSNLEIHKSRMNIFCKKILHFLFVVIVRLSKC